MELLEQKPNKEKVIDPVAWGEDHWWLLYRAEKCAVDTNGRMPTKFMRASKTNHGWLAEGGLSAPNVTRLRSGRIIADYDDYDCLMDLAGADLLTVAFPVDEPARIPYIHQLGLFRWGAQIRLTDKGWKWASFTRRWLASGREMEALSAEYVMRTDPDSVNQVARTLLGSDASLSQILHQMHITEIGEETYRALLAIASPPVTSCVECREWILTANIRDGLCEECYILLALNGEEDDNDFDLYDWGEEVEEEWA